MSMTSLLQKGGKTMLSMEHSQHGTYEVTLLINEKK